MKRLEELGIGALDLRLHLQRLQDLNYVALEKRRFVAPDSGGWSHTFLVRFFEKYVDTGFTSAKEERLDEISAARRMARRDARLLVGILGRGGSHARLRSAT